MTQPTTHTTDVERPLVFLDVETTGLDPTRHEVWQAAYAYETGDIYTNQLNHSLMEFDPLALAMNHYTEDALEDFYDEQHRDRLRFEVQLASALKGATIVGANPAFDTAFLRARWGTEPWHYRSIDIEAYAMPILGHTRPQSLKTIRDELSEIVSGIPDPDHTAAGDVATLRHCWHALGDLNNESLLEAAS